MARVNRTKPDVLDERRVCVTRAYTILQVSSSQASSSSSDSSAIWRSSLVGTTNTRGLPSA